MKGSSPWDVFRCGGGSRLYCHEDQAAGDAGIAGEPRHWSLSLCLPFLLIIMLSGVDLSRALYSCTTSLCRPAREGARVGAVTP